MDSGYSVGELIVMGFSGKSLSADTLKMIRDEKISQYILFTHNYESKQQLIQLGDEIQSYSKNSPARMPFILSADQEGGRVQRFQDGFTPIPSARSIGGLNSPNVAFEIGQILGRELFAAGIQLNFAPVCDIHTNAANPVIGDRAYGSQEPLVTRMASAVVRGHLSENVEACIKHFPGHGDTHLDSHFALPMVTTPIGLLRTREWIPFHRAIKSGCNFIMSAHVLLPQIDPTLPGTLSKTLLTKHLREGLMFAGVVVSDDMEMRAITQNYGAEDAPVMALQAGCDLLCYRSEEQAKIAIEAIKKAVTDRKLNLQNLKRSIDRVRKIRSRIKLAKETLPTQERLDTIGHPNHLAWVAKLGL